MPASPTATNGPSEDLSFCAARAMLDEGSKELKRAGATLQGPAEKLRCKALRRNYDVQGQKVDIHRISNGTAFGPFLMEDSI